MKKGFTHTLNFRKKLVCGFTLLEILLVVGIIAILAGIVIVALNPTKQFAAVRNTQRKANLSELNKALYQYYIDHSHYPTTLTTTLTEICDTEATSTGHSLNCTNKIDLSYLVPTYLVAIPTDPQASGTSTGYLVAKNTANKIHLKADNAELSQTTTIGDTSGVLPDHLVSYWSFDDAGSGTALDLIGGNNGTVNGATATTGVKGVASTAYGFDGSDYINGSILFNCSQPYSFTAWTNSAVGSGYHIVLNSSSIFGFVNNRIYFTPTNNNEKYSNIGYGYANGWNFIVGVFDGSNIILYQNGTEVSGYGTVTTATGCPSGNSTSFMIGDYFYPTWPFNGSIDNVRIYSKALSVEEIMNVYNAEKP